MVKSKECPLLTYLLLLVFGNEALNETTEEVDSGREYEDLVYQYLPNKCFVILVVRDSLVGLISMPLWTYYTFNTYNPMKSNIKLYLFYISMDIFNGSASVPAHGH